MKLLARWLKPLLGMFFVFSALSKFIDLDKLYIYIFSFGFFSLDFSVVIGWGFTAFELLLGMVLLSGRWHRLASTLGVLLLAGFTVFLAYAHLIGRTDSCHCMGELMELNPVVSMLKNAVLIALMLIVWRFGQDRVALHGVSRSRKSLYILHAPVALLIPEALLVLGGFSGWWHMDYYDLWYSLVLVGCAAVGALLLSLSFWKRWYVCLPVVLIPFVAILVLDAYVALFGRNNEEPFNAEVLQRQLNGPLQEFSQGRKVVAFYSRKCNYCRMASQKVSMIQQRHNLPFEAFANVFPGVDTTDVEMFFESDQQQHYAQRKIESDTFLYITYGQFPLVLLLQDGQVIQTYSHSDISEKEICNFVTYEK